MTASGEPPPGRRLAVPAGLAALMAASLLLAVAWSVLTPAFQSPDEQSHFAYVQYLAETGSLPGDPAKPIYSSEHAAAANAVNADQLQAHLDVRPEWSERLYQRWQGVDPGKPRGDGGGTHSAAGYPPAAYAWERIGYEAAGGDLFDRLAGARLVSALWLPITVLATWLLAGELFGRRRLLQGVAAAVPALLPMLSFVSGSTGPDGMLYALWSLTLWLGARTLRAGLTPATGAALSLLVVVACLTKTTSYALLPPLALVVGVGLWRARSERSRPALAALALAALGPVVVLLGGWAALAHSLDRPVSAQLAVAGGSADHNPRHLLSYLWQFYLPRLPGQRRWSHGGYAAFDVWIRQAWGAFGWLEVRFPLRVYLACAAATVTVLVTALVALWRARRRVDRAVMAFLALAVLSLLAGLHWTDYQLVSSGVPFMQGRYLFPVVALMGVAAAAALSLVAARWRATVAGVALGVLLAFNLASFVLVLERFYA